MNSKTLFTLFAAALFGLTACKDKKATDTAENQAIAAVTDPVGPQPSTSDLLQETTLRYSGEPPLVVSIDRRTDRSLPAVKDENDVQFFDNRVSVRVKRGGELLVERSFTKADFESYLPEVDKRLGVMQGMALDSASCTARNLVFGAQVGQPGMDGDGSAFRISMSLPDGGISVERLSSQDTTRDDMEDDESGD